MKKKFLSLLICSLFFSFTACNYIVDKNEKVENGATTEETDQADANSQAEVDSQENIVPEAEHNTSAKVDEIMLQAKDDAENTSEDEATEKWDEAFKYLKEHQANFYENNEVMEQSMYYGTFIYECIEVNATATNISELPDATKVAYEAGLNTVEAIKYVYRGAASTDDEDTQSKLKEATDNLDLINVE